MSTLAPPKSLALEMFADKSFDEYKVDILIAILMECDDLYTNDDSDSYLTDSEYDFLYLFAKAQAPTNEYFLGVGSEVRGTKTLLPFPMGSLNQCYIGDIEDWVNKWNLNDEKVIISDKLDGTSAMVIYDDNGDFQISYSRGNGTEGADISRHMRKMQNCPGTITIEEAITVRGENIIEFSTFNYLQSNFFRKDGKSYKNPRNFMAGVMNAESKEDEIYDYIKFVAYEIVGSKLSKHEQFDKLEEMGFETPYRLTVRGNQLTDEYLGKYLAQRKAHSIYEIDGIVICVDDKDKRATMNPTSDTLNPAYSVKYKVTSDDNMAIVNVVNVEWNISKHGYIKPRVNVEPFDMDGVTISWTTGFHAKFIYDNKIGPNAKVKISRMGNVIPIILEVVEPMPMEAI